MKTQIWAIILVIIGGLIGAFGPIFLKKAASTINFKEFSTILKNKYLFFGVLVYFLSTIVFVPALKGGDLSVLYPLVGLSYVWVCFYSKYMLNEKMTFIKWLGIIIIIIGVSFIGFGA